jgi:hypothetical protein
VRLRALRVSVVKTVASVRSRSEKHSRTEANPSLLTPSRFAEDDVVHHHDITSLLIVGTRRDTPATILISAILSSSNAIPKKIHLQGVRKR